MKKYILALDQGTTTSRALLFDGEARIVGSAQKEFAQIYPRPGWVEHDPGEIWVTQRDAAREVLEQAGASPREVAAIGIANQRETTLVWERDSGRPVANAIVWQCRRTAPYCDILKEKGLSDLVKTRTGLVIDAYFSGTKLKWLLDHVPGARERAARGELLFGTVDSWLIWNLTGGKAHVTDCTNASRTMLYNIHQLKWDADILRELSIPPGMLPDVKPTGHVYGYTDPDIFGGEEIPIAAAVGDQQSALFGQGCFSPGTAKNTYGTGCFMLMHTGRKPVPSQKGLLSTISWFLGDPKDPVEYALEGSIFVAGAAVQWLRDELKLIESAAETEELAARVPDTNGVYMVPAFVGLGAPYWDMYARGAILGLTRGAKREHLVRAALESVAYQTRDVLKAMEEDSGIILKELKVDGGACANNFLMQFQADILGVPVHRPHITESTALGAACLAGLTVGFWRDREEIAGKLKPEKVFFPVMSRVEREELYAGWKKAVSRSLNWAEG